MFERSASVKSTRIQLSALSLYIIQKTVKEKSLLGRLSLSFLCQNSPWRLKECGRDAKDDASQDCTDERINRIMESTVDGPES